MICSEINEVDAKSTVIDIVYYFSQLVKIINKLIFNNC